MEQEKMNYSNYVDNPFQSPAVLSFCPGVRGLETGLEQVIGQIRVAAYVEIEAFIIANLLAGMESGVLAPAPIWTDANTFDASPFRGRIHGIMGGYPCPGESLAGLREGHLYHGFIWPAIRRAIAAARPIWCFFENVDDHLTGTFPIVQRSLRNMGYAVEAGIFSAEELGAPHERKRLFILAMEYTNLRRLRNIWELGAQEELSSVAGSGEQSMADTMQQGFPLRRIKHERDQLPTIERSSNSPGEKIQELADADSGRSRQDSKPGELRTDFTRQPSVYCGYSRTGEHRWPAPPGPRQFPWEEPRTVESGLGSTVNGYKFRPDFLRAIGNMVVPAQAELAFRVLIKKHFK